MLAVVVVVGLWFGWRLTDVELAGGVACDCGTSRAKVRG